MRIVKETSSSNSTSYIDFEKVFLKAIFKALLMNLASGLNNGDLGDSDASLRLKLSGYQRYLMIKGNNPESEYKPGRIALQAINRYQQGKPDISRNRIVKEIKKTVEIADEKHNERMKAYLYKIKKHAKEFVNDKGEIITSLKNTWDIRDIVSEKYCKNINTVLEEEETFDVDKYLQSLLDRKNHKKDKHPVSRKIKAFRENYILERYQKVIQKP